MPTPIIACNSAYIQSDLSSENVIQSRISTYAYGWGCMEEGGVEDKAVLDCLVVHMPEQTVVDIHADEQDT